MAKHPSQILTLAKRGAEAQLQDLLNEIKMLIGLFPHLRDSIDRDELPINFIVAKASGQLTKRGKMSAAARARISAAQKKRWAKAKRAKAGAQSSA